MTNLRDCKHGHLARTCNLCEMERRIEDLESELRRVRDLVGEEDMDIIDDVLRGSVKEQP